MIVRSVVRVQGPRASVKGTLRTARRPLRTDRRYSTANTPPTSASTPQTHASMLATINTDLDKIAPRFEIQPEQIEILKTPAEFYGVLKEKISKAQSRIYLSTLYIGKTEHELIATIQSSLRRNPNLCISFLTDALRGTRESPAPTSASLLAPLISEFGPSRVEIRMFHTPNLTGVRKKLIPKRINEGWGLQHMKLYGVDDEIILSGANLSSDYFTNRQDRYHLFQSKDLTSYFAKIHDGVCKLSFDIQPSDDKSGYNMTWPSANLGPSPLDSASGFKAAATQHLSSLLTPANSPVRLSKPSPRTKTTTTTTIHPVLSLVPLLPTSTELPALTQILTRLASPSFTPSTWTFTSGYFNMTPSFRRLLLSTRPTTGTVLTAHPHANGFYGSAGVSGMLPSAYTYLASQFLKRVRHSRLDSAIELREWKRGMVGQEHGWTYHAKGLWVTLPPSPLSSASTPTPTTATANPSPTTTTATATATDNNPSLTVLGSSNYTKRSYSLDLEANIIITTEDPGLRRRLGEEVRWLGEYATRVGEDEFEKPERKVGVGVRVSMWIVRVLGGAL